MSKYTKLDALILAELGNKPKPFNTIFGSAAVYAECRTFLSVREPFRVLDLRLQALRKAGKIQASTKGWTLAARDGGGS
ncbi:hypothetical protein [Burkholderia gladioli]|uniref:hypothetical protein n=1 Tax=Burkholderia gladioli TaxID=28095 RepID=UPI001640E3D7|nr:hypothetical protein [Burkholderia gladioli]